MEGMSEAKGNNFIAKAAFTVVSVLLLCYAVCRAWKVGMTWDECWSFTHYSLDTAWNIVTYHSNTSNNHVWNSLLMRLEVFTLPFCEFSLRLHSLIAYAFFLWFSWVILKDIQNATLRIAAFLLINLNPFLLDFFALARGYALSLAAMLASLYYLQEYLKRENKRWLYITLALVTAEIAAAGIFSLGTYVVALIGFIMLWSFYEQFVLKRKILLQTTFIVILLCTPFFYWFVYITKRLQAANEFYYGGVDGFWKDTVESLVRASLYINSYSSTMTMWAIIGISIAVVMLSISGIAVLSWKLYRSGFDLRRYARALSVIIILIFCVLGILLQHLILDTRYLFDRTALYLLVLFMAGVGYILYYLFTLNRYAAILGFLLVLPVTVHFLNTMNVKYTYAWSDEGNVKDAMAVLNDLHLKEKGDADYFLGAWWTYSPSVEFYRQYYRYYWMNEASSDVWFCEKYLLMRGDIPDALERHAVKVIKHYPLTQTYLYRNLTYSPHQVLAAKQLNMEPDEVECSNANLVSTYCSNGNHCAMLKPQAFSPGIVLSLQTNDSTLVKVIALVHMDKPSIQGEIIITLSDSSGKVYSWNSHRITHYFNRVEWIPVEFTLKPQKLHAPTDHINVSIWNTSDYTMYIDTLQAKVFRY